MGVVGEFLAETYYEFLLGYGRYLLRRLPVAMEPEDLVHEAWVGAMCAHPESGPWFSGVYLKRWMHGVAVRQYKLQVRRRWLSLDAPLADGPATLGRVTAGSSDTEREALTLVTLGWVYELAKTDADVVLILRIVGGETYPELVGRLGYTKTALANAVAKGRERLNGQRPTRSRSGRRRVGVVL